MPNQHDTDSNALVATIPRPPPSPMASATAKDRSPSPTSRIRIPRRYGPMTPRPVSELSVRSKAAGSEGPREASNTAAGESDLARFGPRGGGIDVKCRSIPFATLRDVRADALGSSGGRILLVGCCGVACRGCCCCCCC